jgi:ABC-type multidrug transport system fused ATPase/permease subunit
MVTHMKCNSAGDEMWRNWKRRECPIRYLCIPDSKVGGGNITGHCSCEFSMDMLEDHPEGCHRSIGTIVGAVCWLIFALVAFAVCYWMADSLRKSQRVAPNFKEKRAAIPHIHHFRTMDVLQITAVSVIVCSVLMGTSSVLACASFFTLQDSTYSACFPVYVLIETLFVAALICSITSFCISIYFALIRSANWDRERRITDRKTIVGVTVIAGAVCIGAAVPLLTEQQYGAVSAVAAFVILGYWFAFSHLLSRLERGSGDNIRSERVHLTIKAVHSSVRSMKLFLTLFFFSCVFFALLFYVGRATHSRALLSWVQWLVIFCIRVCEAGLLITMAHTISSLLRARSVKTGAQSAQVVFGDARRLSDASVPPPLASQPTVILSATEPELIDVI